MGTSERNLKAQNLTARDYLSYGGVISQWHCEASKPRRHWQCHQQTIFTQLCWGLTSGTNIQMVRAYRQRGDTILSRCKKPDLDWDTHTWSWFKYVIWMFKEMFTALKCVRTFIQTSFLVKIFSLLQFWSLVCFAFIIICSTFMKVKLRLLLSRSMSIYYYIILLFYSLLRFVSF